MRQSNNSLNKARSAKNDEFYTLYDTISNELRHYEKQLRGKRIICPCDWDEALSKPNNDRCNFVRYLRVKKQDWGIKSISWSGWNPDDPRNIAKLKHIKKFQDVDYNQYDVVITNPPPSLNFGSLLMFYWHIPI